MSLEAGKAKGKEEEATYHSVSAFGLSTGTLTGTSGMSILKVFAELNLVSRPPARIQGVRIEGSLSSLWYKIEGQSSWQGSCSRLQGVDVRFKGSFHGCFSLAI